MLGAPHRIGEPALESAADAQVLASAVRLPQEPPSTWCGSHDLHHMASIIEHTRKVALEARADLERPLGLGLWRLRWSLVFVRGLKGRGRLRRALLVATECEHAAQQQA